MNVSQKLIRKRTSENVLQIWQRKNESKFPAQILSVIRFYANREGRIVVSRCREPAPVPAGKDRVRTEEFGINFVIIENF